ncbi:MAG: hypothetical protein OEV00_00545, partial [Acidobacteriota bacterium]|nr:hypothetical protein [Acidobacteriota bacterium]
VFNVEDDGRRGAVDRAMAWRRGALGAVAGGVTAVGLVALGRSLEALKDDSSAPFDLGSAVGQILLPDGTGGWILLTGIVVFSLICGLLGAASARKGDRFI